MNCPHCHAEMELLPGGKFWWHKFSKEKKCPITSIPNTPEIVAKLSPNPPPTAAPIEPVAA